MSSLTMGTKDRIEKITNTESGQTSLTLWISDIATKYYKLITVSLISIFFFTARIYICDMFNDTIKDEQF